MSKYDSLARHGILTCHALNELWQQGDEGCCNECCGPCAALDAAFSENRLNEEVTQAPESYFKDSPWWSDELGRVNFGWLMAAWGAGNAACGLPHEH